MNSIKSLLLALTVISMPLMEIASEGSRRTNPCTQLKAAFFLGLAFFARKAMHDYETSKHETVDFVTVPVATIDTIRKSAITGSTYELSIDGSF